ncbi:MAG TPA: carbohydrate kinase [Solirubrobacteraceae bacterium]|nr:carbohydrate kinase [Solirubrobacteraceae bacterium]
MIVVAGEALIDLIPTATADLGVHPGGGPFNTARWLGRLGASVGFLGAIAADPLGQRLRDQLVACGVALDQLVATARPTTLALAQLDPAGAARYSFYPETSMSDVWPEQIPGLMPAELDALYLGSIGLVLEPAASAGVRAVELARERGALVMVDPNIRAGLIEDRAVYLARLQAVLAQTDILKLSVDDLEWLAPGEPVVSAARRYLDLGVQAVLLTAGGEGATVLTASDAVPIPSVAVDVVDTIGAGDAFSAGFLAHWLARGRGFVALGDKTSPPSGAVVESASFAARVAALACGVQGATPPMSLGDEFRLTW